MRNITIRQLRSFVAVSQERSFTHAARRLLVSQSALTVGIKDLEAEIGMQLFDRTTRSVELTAQGRSFLPLAARLLDELSQGIEDLQALASRPRGSVTVTATSSIITVVLAPALAVLAKSTPGIAVRIIEDTADGLTNRVFNGEADFGVTTLWRPIEDLEYRLLAKDQMGVLCPNDHPIATKPTNPTWPDLARYAMVSLGQGAGMRAMLDV